MSQAVVRSQLQLLEAQLRPAARACPGERANPLAQAAPHSGVGKKRVALGATAPAASPKARSPAGLRELAAGAVDSSAGAAAETEQWVPVIPMEALPKGERRIVRQGGLTILLLWYRNEIYAIESTSPAEGAYSEGFVNAKLTQDGCIVCPTTDSTYDLKTGATREWYPNNPVLRFLTPSLRDMITFPVKIEDGQILVSLKETPQFAAVDSTEVVFKGKVRVGQTADNVAVDETRMVVDETEGGFGFTPKNELVNGRAAMIGFVALLVIEAATGKGLLSTTGFLDFLYRNGVPAHLLG